MIRVGTVHVGGWPSARPSEDAQHQDQFILVRALVAKLPGTAEDDIIVPLLLELASVSTVHERFDPRMLHLVRLTNWPEPMLQAMMFPGRGVCQHGRWEHRVRWD